MMALMEKDRKASEFPFGWDERRVRDVLELYESQTEEEAVAEHDAALASSTETRSPTPRRPKSIAAWRHIGSTRERSFPGKR
jgi:hypothetical protein